MQRTLKPITPEEKKMILGIMKHIPAFQENTPKVRWERFENGFFAQVSSALFLLKMARKTLRMAKQKGNNENV